MLNGLGPSQSPGTMIMVGDILLNVRGREGCKEVDRIEKTFGRLILLTEVLRIVCNENKELTT